MYDQACIDTIQAFECTSPCTTHRLLIHLDAHIDTHKHALTNTDRYRQKLRHEHIQSAYLLFVSGADS